MGQNKIMYALLLVLLIETCLFTFGGATVTRTSIYTYITNPSSFTSGVFYVAMFALLLVFTGSSIIPGSLWTVNTVGVFAGISILAVTFVANIGHLGAFIMGQAGAIDNTLATLLMIFLIGPLTIFYLITLFEFARSNT